MSLFLVERYLPGISESMLHGAERRLARRLTGQATTSRVRLIGSVLIRGEDTVLSLFEADDPAAVRRVNEAADFALDRITEVIDVAATPVTSPDLSGFGAG